MITAEYSLLRCYLPGGGAPIQVYFSKDDDQFLEQLKKQAEETGMSVSHAARQILRRSLNVPSAQLAAVIDKKSQDMEIGKSKLVRALLITQLKKMAAALRRK